MLRIEEHIPICFSGAIARRCVPGGFTIDEGVGGELVDLLYGLCQCEPCWLQDREVNTQVSARHREMSSSLVKQSKQVIESAFEIIDLPRLAFDILR